MTAWLLYFVLLRATFLSFSGFASVPMVREDLVIQRGLVTDEQLNGAIAISQASPGPLGLYIVTVGYFAAGVPGAIAGILALATPALLAIPIVNLVRRGRASHIGRAASGIVIASSVLMAVTAVRLAPEALPTIPVGLLGLAALVALLSRRVPPVMVVVLSAMVGLVLG